jgi:aryl-alcohol dehydrogenase-like predicted oxidoreductase
MLEFINIRGTTLSSSRIGLGTWAIGGWMWGGSDEGESVRTIHAALDQGINLIDTALIYGNGRSAEIVGKAVRQYGRRHNILLTDKSRRRLDRRPRRTQLDPPAHPSRIPRFASPPFQTSHIDIYQVHWPDPLVPIEETAGTLRELYEQGKIRAIGVSNHSPEQMVRFETVFPLHTIQPPYNLFEREIERDVLPYVITHRKTTLTYGALCRGLRSGAMRPDRQFCKDDMRKTTDPKFQPPHFAEYLKAANKLDAYAREKFGKRVIHLAVRWLLDQPGVDVALWGARRPEQLAQINEVGGWSLAQPDFKSHRRHPPRNHSRSGYPGIHGAPGSPGSCRRLDGREYRKGQVFP